MAEGGGGGKRKGRSGGQKGVESGRERKGRVERCEEGNDGRNTGI